MVGGGEASDHLGELLTLLCCAGNGFCCSWARQQVLEGGIVTRLRLVDMLAQENTGFAYSVGNQWPETILNHKSFWTEHCCS